MVLPTDITTARKSAQKEAPKSTPAATVMPEIAEAQEARAEATAASSKAAGPKAAAPKTAGPKAAGPKAKAAAPKSAASKALAKAKVRILKPGFAKARVCEAGHVFKAPALWGSAPAPALAPLARPATTAPKRKRQGASDAAAPIGEASEPGTSAPALPAFSKRLRAAPAVPAVDDEMASSSAGPGIGVEGEQSRIAEGVDEGPRASATATEAGEAADPEDDLESDEDIAEEDIPKAVAGAEEPGKDSAVPWPNVWQSVGGGEDAATPPHPGDLGFSAHALRCLDAAAIGGAGSPLAGFGLLLHQEVAAFLVHPTSPAQRLLVDHAAGTGKTLTMLRILDNFYSDPRPKVVLFPNSLARDRFFLEALKWPTRWRSFFALRHPAAAALAAGVSHISRWGGERRALEAWDLDNAKMRAEAKRRGVQLGRLVRELIDLMRDVLCFKASASHEKKKVEEEEVARPASASVEAASDGPVAASDGPVAPLCTLLITTAGGSACDLRKDGRPRSAALRLGFDATNPNPYCRTVVLVDECHHLVRSSRRHQSQLQRLREHLRTATDTVLVGLTGYMASVDSRALLDVIRGPGSSTRVDEGYVSTFCEGLAAWTAAAGGLPRSMTPAGVVSGEICDSLLKELARRHSLHGEALKRYLLKEAELQSGAALERQWPPPPLSLAKLSALCGWHVNYRTYTGTHRDALLKCTKECAPKMNAVAKSIARDPAKALIVISRDAGFRAMLEVLQRAGKTSGFKVCAFDDIESFNDARNQHGERIRVLVAEPWQLREGGAHFRGVRRVHFMDAPQGCSDLACWAACCVRLGSHAELVDGKRALAMALHVAHFPKLLQQGLGSFLYRQLLGSKEAAAFSGHLLEDAIEACIKALGKQSIKTLADLQRELQASSQVADLIVETSLERLGSTSEAPTRALKVALQRLQKGEAADAEALERALVAQAKTADELLLERLAGDTEAGVTGSAVDTSILRSIRQAAVDSSFFARHIVAGPVPGPVPGPGPGPGPSSGGELLSHGPPEEAEEAKEAEDEGEEGEAYEEYVDEEMMEADGAMEECEQEDCANGLEAE